ncbi:MAG: UDP-3-O-(3-hydroxymyristoyl)glucosamine N-acyltransferase [Proteobacteria bacterium]|nr:MAG: UDP-3-O-(3-hydroxymyristoyl)glucosamine N-acyltransferase [Pseudomonadota bacterium]
MALPIDELARRIQGLLTTDSITDLRRIAPLDRAMPGDLSFLANTRFRKRLVLCRASAIIVDRDSAALCTTEPVIVDDLLIACARAGECLPHASRVNEVKNYPVQDYQRVSRTAEVSPNVVLGWAATIGPHTIVGPGCVIGDGARIGAYCELGPNVTIAAAAALGNRVTVGANSSIGGEPFLYVRDSSKWLKLPSFGSVEIGDDVALGSHVTIDRGAIRDTILMAGTKIDNHVHIAHGVIVGRDTAIAARTAIAGEATIGDGCTIGGGVGIGEGVVVAAEVRITAMSMVTKSLPEVGAAYSSTWPATRARRWWRQVSIHASAGRPTS